jgi:hypothetical protein
MRVTLRILKRAVLRVLTGWCDGHPPLDIDKEIATPWTCPRCWAEVKMDSRAKHLEWHGHLNQEATA